MGVSMISMNHDHDASVSQLFSCALGHVVTVQTMIKMDHAKSLTPHALRVSCTLDLMSLPGPTQPTDSAPLKHASLSALTETSHHPAPCLLLPRHGTAAAHLSERHRPIAATTASPNCDVLHAFCPGLVTSPVMTPFAMAASTAFSIASAASFIPIE